MRSIYTIVAASCAKKEVTTVASVPECKNCWVFGRELLLSLGKSKVVVVSDVDLIELLFV